MTKKTIELLIPAILSIFMLASMSCAANQGNSAPSFTLTDVKGSQVTLADFKGQKAVLLIFFNYRTGTGQDPILQSYLAYYQGMDRLQVLSIVNRKHLTDEMKQYAAGQAQQQLGGFGHATPLRDEDGSVSQAFGANPDKLTIVLVDRAGRISFRQEVDAVAETNTELANQVEELTR